MLKQFENRSAGRSPAGPYQAQPLQVCYRIASLPAHAASQHWLHCPRMRMPRGPRMGAELASPHRPRMPHRPPALASARLIGKLGSPRARTPRRPCAGPAAPLPARAPLATDRLLRRDPVTATTGQHPHPHSLCGRCGGRAPARPPGRRLHSLAPLPPCRRVLSPSRTPAGLLGPGPRASSPPPGSCNPPSPPHPPTLPHPRLRMRLICIVGRDADVAVALLAEVSP
jgi:hypothetical protein